MSRTPSSGPQWSGEMLNRPEMMAAFTGQLRQVLNGDAVFVDRIRRDAEAMWEANPPGEYNAITAWWRNWRTRRPFRKMQRRIEKASKLTFQLEARYRRNFHEIPDERRAAVEAREQKALDRGQGDAGVPSRQTARRSERQESNFLDMLRRDSA